MISKSTLTAFRSEHLDADDVFQPGFLVRIIFLGCDESDVVIHPSASPLLDAWGTQEIAFAKLEHDSDTHAAGPYFSYLGSDWEPWRAYKDENLSMTVSFKPVFSRGHTRFVVLSIAWKVHTCIAYI